MSIHKNQGYGSEKPANCDAAISATADLHAEIFSTPQQYLATIKSDFSRLSHDHSSITMADLLVDVKDQSLDQKTRNVAAISAKHFKELVALKESAPSDQSVPAVPNLNPKDIDFLNDIINHKTVKRGVSAAAEDLKAGAMWGALGLGAGFGSTAIIDAGTVTLLTGAAAVAAGAAGVGALGIGGYFAFRAATEIHHYNKLADQDQAQMSRWLK